MPWNFYTGAGALKNAEYVGSEFPAGTIVDFGGTAAPNGWLLCDGATVSRSTYSSLFNVIGTAYGAGDGSTTFKLPDATGKIIYATPGLKLAAPILPSTYVTSLPSNPVDGQTVVYAADASNGVMWTLRYRAASSSSYKWEFVGGSYLGASVATLQSTTSTTYTDLTTSGPTVTPPLSGDYAIRVEAGMTSTSSGEVGAFMSYAIGATAATDTESVTASVQTPGYSTNVSRQYVKNFSSGTALTAKYRGTASTVYFEKRVLAITPVRVG